MNSLKIEKSKKNIKNIDSIFVGRENELARINNSYDKVLQGSMGIVTIVGQPGCGKSFLVDNAVKALEGSTYLYTKNIQSEEFYINHIFDIVDQITKYILTLPKDILDNIVRDLKSELKNDIALLSTLSPVLKNLFGLDTKDNTPDYSKLVYKTKNTIVEFITKTSIYLYPMVLHIDDVQWANKTTIDIINALIKKKDMINIMLIISVRNNSASPTIENFLSSLEEFIYIDLPFLHYQSIEQFIDKMFYGNFFNKEYFVRFIYGMTMGNPFYVKELIKIMLRDGIICYSNAYQKWTMSVNEVSNYYINDTVENILKKNINKELDNNSILIRLIACFSGKVDYDTLKAVSNMDTQTLNRRLDSLTNTAIIMTSLHDADKKTILFSHDIIFKIIEESFDSNEMQQTHFDIACSLINSTEVNINNKNTLIASHLLKSSERALYNDTEKWLKILFDAGINEKQLLSMDSALAMFTLCTKLLPYTESIEGILYTNIYLELAECLYYTDNKAEAGKTINMLLNKKNSKEILQKIKMKQLYLLHNDGRHKDVLKVGMEIINASDITFSPFGISPVSTLCLPLELLICNIKYSKNYIQKLRDGKLKQKEEVSSLLQVLVIMNACATLTSDNLRGPIGVFAALLASKNSADGNSLLGYISYNYILFMIMHNHKKSVLLEDTILQLAEKTNDHSTKAVVYFLIGAFLAHWSKSFKTADEILQKSIYFGKLNGDFLFLNYSIISSLDTKLLIGSSLDKITLYINTNKPMFKDIEQESTLYNYQIYTNYVHALKYGENSKDFDLINSNYPSLTEFEKISEHALMLEKLYLFDEIDTGYSLAQKMIQAPFNELKESKGLVFRVFIIFYSSLIRISVNDKLLDSKKLRNIKTIKKYLNELKYWTNINYENFYSYYALVNTEYEIYIKNNVSMCSEYNNVIHYAKKQGNIKIEALANLRAARFQNKNYDLQMFYAENASSSFDLFGAEYIVQSINKEFNINQQQVQVIEDNIILNTVKEQYNGAIEALQGCNENETAQKILEIIVNKTQSDFCCIIFEKSDELLIKHQINKDLDYKQYDEMRNINFISNIAHKIIRYVGRTNNEVHYISTKKNNLFDSDAHIIDNPNLNITCIPILYHKVFIGLLYIEKKEKPIYKNDIAFIKSMLPTFIMKQKTIKNISIEKLLGPRKVTSVLTKRELALLKLVADGLSNAEICERLNISLSTTKSHIGHIMNKLNVDSRIKAIIKAQSLGLL